MDLTFTVVHLNLDTGLRTELPERFDTSRAAARRAEVLSARHPGHAFLVRTRPGALLTA